MKKTSFRNLLIGLVVLSLSVIWWLSLWTESPSTVVKHHPLADGTGNPPARWMGTDPLASAIANPPADNTAERLVARQIEWRRITNSAEADKVEIELKRQITDANAEAIVRSLPSELLETPFGLMALESWSNLHRSAAVEWLSRQPNPTFFQISTALRGWVNRDVDGVHHYLDNVPEGPWKEKVLAETARDALRAQLPTEAITLLRDLEPGESQTSLARTACILWAQSDPAAAVAWAGKVDDPLLRRQLLGSAGIGSAFSDPQNAATWLLDTLPPGAELNEALTTVVQVWVNDSSNPEDVAAWVAQLPPNGQRAAAVKGLVSEWPTHDPQAFAAWMQNMAAGSLRVEVAHQIAQANSTAR